MDIRTYLHPLLHPHICIRFSGKTHARWLLWLRLTEVIRVLLLLEKFARKVPERLKSSDLPKTEAAPRLRRLNLQLPQLLELAQLLSLDANPK